MLIKICKLYVVINLLWVLLTTCVPQILYNGLFTPTSGVLSAGLANSDVYFLIAHPDDEVMFFAPTIIELAKPHYNNSLHLICLSNGDAQGLGTVREKELIRSAQILGFPGENVVLLNDTRFVDSMDLCWDKGAVSSVLGDIVKPTHAKVNIITFDEEGVSNHPNHISMFHGAKQFVENAPYTLFKLNSLSRFEKYSFTLLSIKMLVVKYFRIYKEGPTVEAIDGKDIVHFFSDLPGAILAIAAMSSAHVSQMVWFRWLWLMFSRFVNFNELIRVHN